MFYKHIMGFDHWLKQTDNWEGGHSYICVLSN